MPNEFILSLIDELAYRNYAVNRQRIRSFNAAAWRKVYGPQADLFAQRYASEHPEPTPRESAAEIMDGERPIGVQSANLAAGPTLGEVLAEDDAESAGHDE